MLPIFPPAIVARPAFRLWTEVVSEVYETSDMMGISLNEAFHLVRTMDSTEVP